MRENNLRAELLDAKLKESGGGERERRRKGGREEEGGPGRRGKTNVMILCLLKRPFQFPVEMKYFPGEVFPGT